MTFSPSYFSHLNYTLANEDTRLELAICEREKPRHILSICGSGGRFLPLLAAGPETVVAVDVAPQQLALAELREATIRSCDFENFCLFWGFPPSRVDSHMNERRLIYQGLTLDGPTRDYFDDLFRQNGWKGLIYEGKWEKTIISVPRLLRRFVGTRYDTMFNFCDKAQQNIYLQKKLQSNLWKSVPQLVILIFGNAAFFNAMLYRGKISAMAITPFFAKSTGGFSLTVSCVKISFYNFRFWVSCAFQRAIPWRHKSMCIKKCEMPWHKAARSSDSSVMC